MAKFSEAEKATITSILSSIDGAAKKILERMDDDNPHRGPAKAILMNVNALYELIREADSQAE